jgi:CRISPR-associated protein Cas1
MPTIYLTDQGAVAHKRGERLVVRKEGKDILDIPLVHVDQLVVMGNIQLTTPLVAQLLLQEVDVAFFSSRGKFRGRLTPPGSKFGELRHRQLQVLNDPQASLAIARPVARGKLGNQRRVLGRLVANASSEVQAAARKATETIQAMERQAAAATDIDSLRGYEGSGAAAYFSGLKALIPAAWGFTGRAYFPPPDPVNAALSFGYALLQNVAMGAVQLVGLDPYLGFFHVIDYGRPSLALDVMEEFRPLVVDAIVVPLLVEGQLTSRDFRHQHDPKPAVLLADEGRNRLIEAYEKHVNGTVVYPATGEKTALRRCVELQVRHLARVVMGHDGVYKPMEA